jgi:DNA-binding NarL/FixJ family response regulator
MQLHSVVVIDERAVFRRGVVAILDADPALHVVGHAPDGPFHAPADVAVTSPAAYESLSRFHGPVVVCCAPADAPRPQPNGRRLVVVEPHTRDAGELVQAVRRLAVGDRAAKLPREEPAVALDARACHVLRLLADGADTHGISRSLYYSERTVKSLIHDIAQRLGARTRAEAVAKGIRLGLI